MSESFLVFLVMSNLTDLNAASLIFPDRFGLLLQGFLKFNYEYDSAINVITIKVLKYFHTSDCLSHLQVEKSADGPLQYNFCMTGDLGAI